MATTTLILCDLNATFGHGAPVRVFAHHRSKEEASKKTVPVVREEEKKHVAGVGQEETLLPHSPGSPAQPGKEAEPATEEQELTPESLSAMYKADLVRLCVELGLPHKRSNKSVLIRRLLDAQKAGKQEEKTSQEEEEVIELPPTA
jgi:hypothetical protein